MGDTIFVNSMSEYCLAFCRGAIALLHRNSGQKRQEKLRAVSRTATYTRPLDLEEVLAQFRPSMRPDTGPRDS
jgi:hypothetical protein